MTAAAATIEPRRQLQPLRGTTCGTPATGDLRGLAAVLLRLDQRPLRIVAPAPAEKRPATTTA